MIQTTREARDFFEKKIRQLLLGPGSDILTHEQDLEREVIAPNLNEFDINPLERYTTGVLFPLPKSDNQQVSEFYANEETGEFVSVIENDIAVETELDSDNYDNGDYTNEIKTKSAVYPNIIGLSCRLPNATQSVSVKINTALYYEIEQVVTNQASDIYLKRRIALSAQWFELFKSIPNNPFVENQDYKYVNGYFYLLPVSGLNTKYRKLKAEPAFENNIVILRLFNIIFNKEVWVRFPFEVNFELLLDSKRASGTIPNILTQESIKHFQEHISDLEKAFKAPKLTLHWKIIHPFNHGEGIVLKILLQNSNDSLGLSVSRDKVAPYCFFQTKLRVEAPLLPFKETDRGSTFDMEAQRLAFLYRHRPYYGIGHNIAVQWQECTPDESPSALETEYIPAVDIVPVSNEFRSENKTTQAVAQLYNLSIFSAFDKNKIIAGLSQFVEEYAQWINTHQLPMAEKERNRSTEYNPVIDSILAEQQTCLARLRKGVQFLHDNEAAYKCFLWANTAMYIQMLVSAPQEAQRLRAQMNATPLDLAFFEHYPKQFPDTQAPQYRPFQLAFLLLCLPGIVEKESPERNEIVDLLWFPTGGGKTEAYLALSAFTILWRRMNYPQNYQGVSVIMRYTLRLLTAQQFERAARLICALDFLRKTKPKLFGADPITIGMWVGMSSTPNKLNDAEKCIKDINGEISAETKAKNKPLHEALKDISRHNKFQVHECPWCSTPLITALSTKALVQGFSVSGDKFLICCQNKYCNFSEYQNYNLPLDVVDESLYNHPPTLLFGTVDKFAMLAHEPGGVTFFNSLTPEKLPPDLIIQDELHLLNGPLGSVTAFFERAIEWLCVRTSPTNGNTLRPKIVASTATTRNAHEQVKNLYHRKLNIFPASGLDASDSYFAYEDTSKQSLRRYIGFMPTGQNNSTHERMITAALLVIRAFLYEETKAAANRELLRDNYWTVLSYFNSLRDLGRSYNALTQLEEDVKALFFYQFGLPKELLYYTNLKPDDSTLELTSRIPSNEIKFYFQRLAESLAVQKNIDTIPSIQTGVALALATNMISVGLDVSRLNLMLINGQPANVAEYIQASSRVARKEPGLIISLYKPTRPRERSYYEHFLPFHRSFYRFVEPITITPFTNVIIERTLNSLLLIHTRYKDGLLDNNAASLFDEEARPMPFLDYLLSFLPEGSPSNEKKRKLLKEKFEDLVNDWTHQAKYGLQFYKGRVENLIPQDRMQLKSKWNVATSMRDIDTPTIVKFNNEKAKPNKASKKNQTEDFELEKL